MTICEHLVTVVWDYDVSLNNFDYETHLESLVSLNKVLSSYGLKENRVIYMKRIRDFISESLKYGVYPWDAVNARPKEASVRLFGDRWKEFAAELV